MIKVGNSDIKHNLRSKMLTLMAVKDRLQRICVGDLEKHHRQEINSLLDVIQEAENEVLLLWAKAANPDALGLIKKGAITLTPELEIEITNWLGLTQACEAFNAPLTSQAIH